MKKTLLLITAACLTFLSSRAQTNSSTNAVPNKPPTAESALVTLAQEWADAVKHQDAGAIDRIQAEEYMFTDPAGHTFASSMT